MQNINARHFRLWFICIRLKYLTIKKNNIKRNRILMIVLPLIKLVFYQATSNSVYDSVTRCLFYVHIFKFQYLCVKT